MRTPILNVYFYETEHGEEPVKRWLRNLPLSDKKSIGEDIKTAQFGWPIGMPLVGYMGDQMWEVRSKVGNGIARVLFVLDGNSMILIHAFIKKQQKTPQTDLDLAKQRIKKLRNRS